MPLFYPKFGAGFPCGGVDLAIARNAQPRQGRQDIFAFYYLSAQYQYLRAVRVFDGVIMTPALRYQSPEMNAWLPIKTILKRQFPEKHRCPLAAMQLVQ